MRTFTMQALSGTKIRLEGGRWRLKHEQAEQEAKPCFDVMPKLLSVDGDIVLVHPVGVEDGALERLLAVDVGEVAHGDLVDMFHGPGDLETQDWVKRKQARVSKIAIWK